MTVDSSILRADWQIDNIAPKEGNHTPAPGTPLTEYWITWGPFCGER